MTTTTIADWDVARRVAERVASSSAMRVDPGTASVLRADLHAAVAKADPVARSVTGLGADLEPATAHVVGRTTWIRLNLASIAWVTDPLADKLLDRTGVQRAVARKGLGVQLGVVVGYLASRVLGQYEVLRPGNRTPGRLLLVGPNLLSVERRHLPETGVDAREFRFGVVLHELAHRLQFEGVPWLRGHLHGLLDAYFSEASLDNELLKEMAGRLPDLLRDRDRLRDPQNLVQEVLTPEQGEVFEQAQAMMSLLEGHGNAVMDWGAEQVGDFDPARVRTVLNRRRSKPGEQALRNALGLGLKAQQYATGERFILDVAERHGRETFNRVWDDPAMLPTGDELADSDAWVQRVAP